MRISKNRPLKNYVSETKKSTLPYKIRVVANFELFKNMKRP